RLSTGRYCLCDILSEPSAVALRSCFVVVVCWWKLCGTPNNAVKLQKRTFYWTFIALRAPRANAVKLQKRTLYWTFIAFQMHSNSYLGRRWFPWGDEYSLQNALCYRMVELAGFVVVTLSH